MYPVWHFVNGVPQIGPLTVSGSAVTSAVPVLHPDGSGAAPSVSFASNTGDGLSWMEAGDILVSVAGAGRYLFSNDVGFNLGADMAVAWASASGPTKSNADVSLSRLSANVLGLASGDSFSLAQGYIAGFEMTAPAAPAANGYRLFAQDNGAGKVQLMVLFPTGAAQQLAIEP